MLKIVLIIELHAHGSTHSNYAVVVNIGSRMNNFNVGLSNIAPTVSNPTPTGYTLCGRGPDVAPDGQNMTVACTTPLSAARYVIIRTGTNDNINFCEVQVFGASKSLNVIFNSHDFCCNLNPVAEPLRFLF